MKKFWIINICLTSLLLAIAIWGNSQLYGTLWELRIAISSIVLIIFQFIVCCIYSLFHLNDYTKVGIALGLLSVGFMGLCVLFIFNGIIWDTDTGWLRQIN